MLEAPIAIDTSVVIDKHGGVEAIDTVYLVGIIGVPVADLEWSLRTVAFGDEGITSARLVVGEEVIGFLACAVCYQGYVRCEKHVGSTCGVKGFTLGILVDHEDDAVVTPLAQVLNGSRPYHLVATAIGRLDIVMRTIDIYALFPWVIRVLKHVGLTIGNMLPKRQIGVTNCCQRVADSFLFAGA